MKPIFLDTVGLIALWNRSDQWHVSAKCSFDELAAAECDLVTTSAVLLECGNAAARQPFRHEVVLLRRNLESREKLIFPTREDWEEAWQSYETGTADRVGIVDCLSFAVMRRLGLHQVFTNDRHFNTAGFETLF
ncbi:MAG: type II toxin-antitoxin system VapC family toxin [Pirellulales bacterium]|nr:type II toxin-antitoxin system VapC family toxin [Pirellulales bacterium]